MAAIANHILTALLFIIVAALAIHNALAAGHHPNRDRRP